MTSWGRAGVGAVIGALVVLLFHPATARYYSTALWRTGDCHTLRASPLVRANIRTAPELRSSADAAYWMLLASGLSSRRLEIGESNREELLTVSTRSAAQDPDNAFWWQMKSYFEWDSGRPQRSIESWLQAAACIRWDDYQNDRLLALRSQIDQEYRGRLAWVNWVLYGERSSAIAQTMLLHARRLWIASQRSDCPVSPVELRAAIVRNGALLRTGSKSLPSALYGIEMSELATRDKTLRDAVSAKRLLLSRFALVNELIKKGDRPRAQQVNRDFADSDAWAAVINNPDADQTFRHLGMLTALSGMAASVALGIAVFGAICWFVGVQIRSRPWVRTVLSPRWCPVLGGIAGLATYLATGLLFPALWTTLSLGFFAIVPKQVRTAQNRDPGHLFRILVLAFSMATSTLVALFLAGASAPGQRILGEIGLPREFLGGSTLLLGLISILLGLTLNLGPLYGFVQRVDPITTAGAALASAGRTMLFVFSILAAILGPLCLNVDRTFGEPLRQIAENEPLYYYRLGA